MLYDLRYAARLLTRSPGFAIAAIVTLAMGIGMTAAIFGVVDTVLFRAVPFPDADRLVMVWETDRDTGTSHEPGAWPDFIDFQQRSRRIDAFAGVIAGEATLTPERGEPTRLASLVVTRGFLPLLGVTPVLGRSFTEEDEQLGGPPTVLISERLWRRELGADPTVIGRTLRVDDRLRTIIGVLATGADFGVLQILSAADYSRGFADRDARSVVDVVLPLQADPQRLVRDTHPLLMIGRLAPGASLATAQEEMAAIAADLERTYESNKARGVFLEPLDRVIFGPTEPALLVLLAAVGVVLLISCVNVANLLLARGTARQREVAVRAALGAETRHLMRQFTFETLTLTLIASAIGIALAFAAVQTLIGLAPPQVPRLALVSVDERVLALSAAVAMVVGVLFGLLPLAQSRRTDLCGALNAESTRGATMGRSGRAVRSALVVAEVALAVVLVAGAGLLIKSFWRLQQVDPGFDPSGVLKAQFQLPGSRYPIDFKRWPEAPAVQRFNDLLLARATALPDVESAAIAVSHPLDAGYTNSFVIVGREQESRDLPEISVRQVTPDYFRTLRVPVINGRPLADGDAASAPAVMLINNAAAQRLFPDREPVGQQIGFWGARRTIVGIVGDEKIHGITTAAPIAAYVPLAQAPSRGGDETLLVRAAREPGAIANAVRSAIAEIDPALAVYAVEPLEDTLSESVSTRRFLMLLLAVFALVALALAAVGVHGILSYTVAERTREIGVRIALGASPRTVTRLVMRQSAILTAVGLGLGMLLSLLFARGLASVLFGVSTSDGATLAGVAAVLAIVSGVATWLPVRRATRIDPIVAMRE